MKTEEISDEELLRINPEKQPLTVEKLRSFEGLENLSDEEAQEMVFSIRTFCLILLEAVKQSEKQAVVKSIEPITNQLKQAA